VCYIARNANRLRVENCLWLTYSKAIKATQFSNTKELNSANKNEFGLGAGGSCLKPSYSGGRDQEDHSSKPA
jgi:hypothetical protein